MKYTTDLIQRPDIATLSCDEVTAIWQLMSIDVRGSLRRLAASACAVMLEKGDGGALSSEAPERVSSVIPGVPARRDEERPRNTVGRRINAHGHLVAPIGNRFPQR